MGNRLRPLQEIPASFCRDMRGILFDIDDTFTFQGKIPPGAFSTLWEAKSARLILTPITGRPAGWADHMARMWPVDGIVGENGAFYFCSDKQGKYLKQHFFVEDASLRAQNLERLGKIFAEVKRSFPTAKLAADQPYRACDLAVDYCEDVCPPLTIEEARQIQEIFEEYGASAKISSIHVNAWFGEYNKLSMCKRYFRQEHTIDLQAEKDRFLFCGDSPNDSPMFAFFPFSVGVAGVRRFQEAGLMDHTPSFIADQDGGLGFEETLKTVLKKRGTHT
jgi:HAD superfamily hydrolase (TIGR01484 family)